MCALTLGNYSVQGYPEQWGERSGRFALHYFHGALEIFNIFGAIKSFIYLQGNNYEGNRSEGNAESAGPPPTKPKLPSSLKFTPREREQVRPHNT
jgi:hypothetical protein